MRVCGCGRRADGGKERQREEDRGRVKRQLQKSTSLSHVCTRAHTHAQHTHAHAHSTRWKWKDRIITSVHLVFRQRLLIFLHYVEGCRAVFRLCVCVCVQHHFVRTLTDLQYYNLLNSCRTLTDLQYYNLLTFSHRKHVILIYFSSRCTHIGPFQAPMYRYPRPSNGGLRLPVSDKHNPARLNDFDNVRQRKALTS
jgi:hypothetical protein